MQTGAKIVSSNLKMTAPTKHAQLVSTIFELSMTKRTVMCLREKFNYTNTGKVKSAFGPSGPSGRRLSPVSAA